MILKIGPRYVSVIKRAQDKYCFKIEYLGELHIWAQDMFQLLKLGSTSRDPNFFLRNLRSWWAPKWAQDVFQLSKGPKTSIVSEIKYLGELHLWVLLLQLSQQTLRVFYIYAIC